MLSSTSGDPFWGCITSGKAQPWGLGKGRGKKRGLCPHFPKSVQLYRGYKSWVSSPLIVTFQVTSVLGGALWEDALSVLSCTNEFDEAFLQGCDMATYKGWEENLNFTSALKHSGKHKCWNDDTGHYYKVIKYRKYCFLLSPKLNYWMILQDLLVLLCHGWAAKPKWPVAMWGGWDSWLLPFALQTDFHF